MAPISHRIAAAILAALCALTTMPFACRAEENPDDRKLLDALKSDDFDAREAAKKKLIDRGEEIRALITAEQAKPDLDADYKKYLQTILGKLKDADVLKAFDAAKRIDLDVKDETVRSVLEKLKEHFGFVAVAKDDAGAKKITLQLKGASFFEAVDAVRKAANLAYDTNELTQLVFRPRGRVADDAAGGLTLKESGDDSIFPAAAKGPVLVFFQNINYNLSKNISFGNGVKNGGRSQKYFNIQGMMISEPGLRCSALGLTKFQTIGANAENIVANNVSFSHFGSGARNAADGFMVHNFSASFSPQSDPSAALTWKMTAKIQVPVKVAEKRIENLTAFVGKTEEIFGGSFSLISLDRAADGWKLSYKTTGALIELGSNRHMGRFNAESEAMTPGNPDFASGMQLLDSNGKAIDSHSQRSHGNGTSNQVEQEMSIEPRTILFRKPSDTATRDFELEIPNVPVP